MRKRVLITGGAGFIGSHLADELLSAGYDVRALDNLSPQVHGFPASRPAYLARDVELIVGDVRDPARVREALKGVDAVFHLAAAVGVGQSMYEIAQYTAVNNLGTAILLEAILGNRPERLVVASSMSIYGEGRYADADGAVVDDAQRSLRQLREGDWDPRDGSGRALVPRPTPETKPPSLASVYALSKYDQERLCMMIGRAYGIPTVALRFFNGYGTRQALSNPYTGVLAIFASRLLRDQPPLIFEDGNQLRDFVDVRDLARGCRLALETEGAADRAINLGSGRAVTIREVAGAVAKTLGKEAIRPALTGKHRMGDIRHCHADISLARAVLGYDPHVTLEEGLVELASWLAEQEEVRHAADANAELSARGLTV